MQFKNISLLLLGSTVASAASIERRDAPAKAPNTKKVFKALAGIYSLVNTSRYASSQNPYRENLSC
jgi:hypothetical protein